MNMEKAKFLDYLSHEYHAYCAIPTSDPQHKREKKQFVNGLMTASRLFGVSIDELNAVIDSKPQPPYANIDEMLEIPTYIRQEIEIKA